MRLGTNCVLRVSAAFVVSQAAGLSAHAVPVQWSANGHYYEVITATRTWPQAYTEASNRQYLGMKGHLATVTSAEENQFLTSTFGLSALALRFLGGFQLAGAAEPGGGWQWITGEPFVFAGWSPGEPNNFIPNENVLIFDHLAQAWGKPWNDYRDTVAGNGYVVEYERLEGWQNFSPSASSPSSQMSGIWGKQVGLANDGTKDCAWLWNGTAAMGVNLNPAGASSSIAWGIRDGVQVGEATFAGKAHAGLWRGTAASWFDLHPAGTDWSRAKAVYGEQQVGNVYFPGDIAHASLWSSTAASWVDLHEPGADWSEAYDIYGSKQVGRVIFGGLGHAALWAGTAASRIDLNPAGATTSAATGMDESMQAGRATIDGLRRAGIWRGSAASFVSIGPDGATDSQAEKVSGGFQVGYSWFAGDPHASLWRGTKASWKDLSLMLPSTWPATFAFTVWRDGNTLYVGGGGVRTENPIGAYALLWTLPICESDFNLDDVVDDRDFVSFAAAYDNLMCDDPAMTPGCPEDLNGDGVVDDADFVLFAHAYDDYVCP